LEISMESEDTGSDSVIELMKQTVKLLELLKTFKCEFSISVTQKATSRR